MEEVSDGSGSLKSWDAVEAWEPEEEGAAARLGQRLKAQVQVSCLEAQEEGCQLRFLKEGCKTLSRARSQEHQKIIDEFQKRRGLKVLELWKQTTGVSKLRLKRLGRAMGYWKFVVDNDEEKQRLTMEDRLEKHDRQLQRFQVLGGIAMTATVSSLCLALLWFLKDRAWKKSFRERQLQIEDEIQNKEKEYKMNFQIDLDKVEQRVKKSLNLEHRQSSAAVHRLAKQMEEQLKELEQRQQEASDESNRRIDLLRDLPGLLRFRKLGQRRSRL